jgi:sulfur-oxidizing protein SoxY
MINSDKRDFLKSVVALGGLGVGAALGLVPLSALAAWPEAAFKADELAAAAEAFFGAGAAADSDAITLKAPDIAENGAVVPISVATDIPGVTQMAIFVEGNPSPLAATFDLGENGVADISTRIKMGKTSNVVAMVQADGKLYQTAKEVKVTIGGCGG